MKNNFKKSRLADNFFWFIKKLNKRDIIWSKIITSFFLLKRIFLLQKRLDTLKICMQTILDFINSHWITYSSNLTNICQTDLFLSLDWTKFNTTITIWNNNSTRNDELYIIDDNLRVILSTTKTSHIINGFSLLLFICTLLHNK